MFIKKNLNTPDDAILSMDSFNVRESFSNFIFKYKSDSVFQKRHILFPVKITYHEDCEEDSNTEVYLTEHEWNYDSFQDTLINGECLKYQIDTVNFFVTRMGCDSGVNIEYVFKKKDNSWFLVSIDDYSN